MAASNWLTNALTADRDATQIGTLYRSATSAQAESVRALQECGRLLAIKRDSIPHGGWMLWLKDNQEMLGFDIRTAQRLLRLANTTLTTHLDEATAVAISRQVWGNETEVSPTPPSNLSTHYRRISGFLDWLEKHPAGDIPDSELIELQPRIAAIRQWIAEIEGKAKRLNLRLAG